jgi:histidinol-phosphatase
VRRGELVLVLWLAMNTGERAWAVKGGGAFSTDGGFRSPLRESSAACGDPLIGNVKTLSRGPGWNVPASLIQRSGRTCGYGDFLHYHLLGAQGSIDLRIESDLNILMPHWR